MANQQLSLLAQQAQGICEQLERGQADTPLSDGVQRLMRDLKQAPLTVALLGLTQDSVERVLAWLYGDVFKGFMVDSKQWPGFVEITLSQQGFSFGLQKSQQQKFDAQEAFLQALQIEMGATQPATKSTVANPFAMQAQSSRGLAGLHLLIPDTAAALLDTPSLLNAIIAQTNIAMVAAPLRYTLSREDHEAVEALTANMRGFWPLLTVDELAEEVSLPDVGWWEQHNKPSHPITPKLITSHVQASLPTLLTDQNDPQRVDFIDSFYAQKLSDNLNAIYDRYQQQAGVLEQRKARTGSPARDSGVMQDRRAAEKLRLYLDENVLNARKNIESQVQELSLQNSVIVQAANRAIGNIQFSNITVTESHSILKLSLNEKTVLELRNVIFRQAKLALEKYYGQTESHLASVLDGLNQQLKVLAIPSLNSLEFPGQKAIFHALDNRLEFNVNYRGEMPKRTVMTRLGESRKLIMGLSMATMVLGGVAKAVWHIDLRSSVMAIAPLILIGGFAYTFVQWPKEDAEKLTKELEKVRDGLNGEMRRVIGDVQRFIQQQLIEIIETQKRFLQKNLQETQQNYQADIQQRAAEERVKQQQGMQQIDQELRQWQSTERQLERLRSEARSLTQALNRKRAE